MSDNLARAQQAVTRAGKATRILLAVSVVLLVVLGGILAHLVARQNTLRDGVREDALWAVYQLDREVRSLGQEIDHILAQGTVAPGDVDSLTQRYDILYSRLALLKSKSYAAMFEANPTFTDKAATAGQMILRIQPFFDTMMETGTVDLKTLREIDGLLILLQPITESILTSTNGALSTQRADARDNVMKLQSLSGIIVVVLAVSIGFLIFNLKRQIRIVHTASEGLALTAQELNTAYQGAEAGNRAKSEFMATMGHEIRTPLNAILGMAELLSHAQLGPEEREHVSVITSSGSALLEILNEILDFSKLEHDKMTFETVPFDVRRLAHDAAHVMDGRAKEQQTRLEVITDALEDESGYLSDPTLVRRVLLNLVSNAVKFTKDGTVRIVISERRKEAVLRFDVNDTGIGISAEARERLFNPFTQVDGSIARRFGGTGLGLAICKKIVEALGGKIGVESVVGVGSKFWFEIPAVRCELPQSAKAERAKRSAALPRLRVLVVEDNEVNRKVAGRFLERLGQNAVLAEDGEAGVRIAAEDNFDVILMDMQMPGLDGIAATKLIRAAGNTTPIYALTANASERDRELCLAAGMNGFESKPVTMKRLTTLLADIGASHMPADETEDQPAAAPAAAVQAAAPEASTEPEGAVMGGSRMNELLAAVGEEEFQGIVEMFFADAPAMLREVGDAMRANEHARIDRALHNLKGAAATLGFERLAGLAQSYRESPPGEKGVARLEQEISAIGRHLQRKAA